MIVVYHHHHRQMVAKIEYQEKILVEPSPNGIASIMKSVIDLCNDNKNGANRGNGLKSAINRESVVIIEDLLMKDLYATIEQYKLHINFLKESIFYHMIRRQILFKRLKISF